MVGRAQTVNATAETAAAEPTFTMQNLWRLALWGSTAAAALLLAILTTRSDVGSQRVATVLSSLRSGSHPGQATTQVASQAGARQFDAESAARQVAQAVRGLADDRDRLMKRLAAVEHNMDDMTGSITRQIEKVKDATAQAAPPPWPSDEPPVPATPATIASVIAPVVPTPAGLTSPLPPSPLMPAMEQVSPPEAAAAAPQPTAYGVDIGSAVSIQALHARWAGTRSAHPQLFEGLQAFVTLKEIPRSNRVELRLIVGPLPSPGAAVELCASLAAFRLFCQPTNFDGQHLALQ